MASIGARCAFAFLSVRRAVWSLGVLCAALPCTGRAFGSDITLLGAAPSGPTPPWSQPGPRPVRGVYASVDDQLLAKTLSMAPAFRSDQPLSEYGLMIDLPHPSGVMMACFVADSPVMEPGLSAKFPMMRTYVVQSADSLASGRIELTQRGLTGMPREPADLGGAGDSGGTWMIDRWRSGDRSNVVAYWLRDLPSGGDWVCETAADVHPAPTQGGSDSAGTTLLATTERRDVRLAMACTGEYGLHHSTLEGNPPNVADPLAAIVTVVSRANVVFEGDLAVHFDLVADNDLVVFFDPATDPYPDTCDGLGGSDCSGPLLGVNRTTLSDEIGDGSFDLGHCVTRIAGGVAFLRSVCTSSKAGGISGIPRGGDVDPLSALVVIHEFGHQFGANHTFSGTRGRCGNNARLDSAWEAGSGSSPMAYAGGCPVGDEPPSDNIVQFADPWFHHGSLEEMQSFLASATAGCLSPIASGNNAPEIVTITSNAAIPPGTPFLLSAFATDADSDSLTYSWEQFDSGERRPLTGQGSEDNGQGALFRIFPPVASGLRSFPQWSDVLAGDSTPGEQLPTVTGAERRFRVVVRDNAPQAGGATISGFVDLEIASGASAFEVLTPAEGASLGAGVATIAWSVGNTDLAPIACESVRIRLSTDGGESFPTDLGTFGNTGSATVVLPAAVSTEARLLLEPVGGIFFAVSGPFQLSGCRADVNADGQLTPADFSAWIAAFTASAASCDQNGDGVCTPADFGAWISNYNAGCE